MKVILTADDYGALDSIDNAILRALEARKINSVAIFPNALDLNQRLTRILKVKERLDSEGFQVDLGCHLTFCTGRPLGENPTSNFVDQGLFKPFTKTQRAPEEKRTEELAYVRREIKMQIKNLEDAGVEVKHLTCHHNTLCWFADYFEELCAVAGNYEGRKIPMRSPIFYPHKRFRTYKKKAMPFKNGFFFLRGNRTRYWYKEWRKRYLTDVHIVMNRNEVLTPEVTYNGHYGPLPGSNLNRTDIEKSGPIQKHKKLKKFFDKHRDVYNKVEIMLHLVDNDYSKLTSIYKEFNAFENGDQNKYPNMNDNYIYGRMTEMNSIMRYNLPEGVEMGRWSTN
jgi:hypothetical protein